MGFVVVWDSPLLVHVTSYVTRLCGLHSTRQPTQVGYLGMQPNTAKIVAFAEEAFASFTGIRVSQPHAVDQGSRDVEKCHNLKSGEVNKFEKL